MTPVKTIASTLNLLDLNDVDTDQIIPARFLKTTEKRGLGDKLFSDWRGARFWPQAGARILVAGVNFGCGSSREHAVWALTDHGFEAVIARSFADIFAANALKNGLVPVVVDAATHAQLKAAFARDAATAVGIDVATATLTMPDGSAVPFPLDPFARRCLVDGIDELDYLLQKSGDIAAFESRHG